MAAKDEGKAPSAEERIVAERQKQAQAQEQAVAEQAATTGEVADAASEKERELRELEAKLAAERLELDRRLAEARGISAGNAVVAGTAREVVTKQNGTRVVVGRAAKQA